MGRVLSDTTLTYRRAATGGNFCCGGGGAGVAEGRDHLLRVPVEVGELDVERGFAQMTRSRPG